MKFASWYGILVGILIFVQWLFFLVTDQVPELAIAPWEIGCHIAAELLMGAVLVAGGVASLRSRHWGVKILLVALGMAIYSEINSPGYFAQLGQWPLVGMFAVLLCGALLSVALIRRAGYPGETSKQDRWLSCSHPDSKE